MRHPRKRTVCAELPSNRPRYTGQQQELKSSQKNGGILRVWGRAEAPRLDHDGLTVRAAHALTGTAAADFSRIRNVDLTRFTLDRLVGFINRLGSRVEVKLKIRPAARAARESEVA